MKIILEHTSCNITKKFENKKELCEYIENYLFLRGDFYLYNKKLSVNELIYIFFHDYKRIYK